jgi:hypothetical protein
MCIPLTYIKEMVSDWRGAGKAIYGKDAVKDWYNTNKSVILLEYTTRQSVEKTIEMGRNNI